MPLTRIPSLAATVDALVHAGGEVNDFGITTPPRHFDTPDFTINCQQNKAGWWATIHILETSSEGVNNASYLGKGLHRSGLMMQGALIAAYQAGPNNREIYRDVTERVALLSLQAETEHCNDILRAYELTLEAGDTVLSNARADLARSTVRYPKRIDAMKAALHTLVQRSPHARIATLFRNCVNINQNVDRLALTRAFRALYLDIADMTAHRDQQGWHTFSLQRHHESWGWRSWAEYSRYSVNVLPQSVRNSLQGAVVQLYGNEKDVRDITTPAPFQVPGPGSAVVVHY